MGGNIMNAIIKNIKNRRSIRRYKTKQILDSELMSILEAGRYAPSGGNNQTTHLIVIQKQEVLEDLKKLVEQAFSQMTLEDGMYKSLQASIKASIKGGYNFFYNAPTLVVVANQRGYGNAMADSACVLENMMLAASSLNVASCWINQLHWLDENAEIKGYMQQLGLLENETICGGLSLGYADGEPSLPIKRVGNQVTFIK
jgi:nitroreductase